jgi:5-methylcytosine-specific restriction protein A
MLRGRKKPEGAASMMERAARRADEAQALADRLRASRRWRDVRAQVLRDEPLCRACTARGETMVAQQVDHILPVVKHPGLAFDRANLQPLCTGCHADKGQVERGTARVRREPWRPEPLGGNTASPGSEVSRDRKSVV